MKPTVAHLTRHLTVFRIAGHSWRRLDQQDQRYPKIYKPEKERGNSYITCKMAGTRTDFFSFRKLR